MTTEPSDSPPAVLYHYTTFAGVCGIATSKTIWATSIRHLNDATEYIHAYQTLRDLLLGAKPRLKSSQATAIDWIADQIDVSNITVRTNFMGHFGATYVASLSTEPDRLSQWRAYSPGGGYALGFRLTALRAMASSQGFQLVKCIYDRDLQHMQAKAIADSVVQQVEEVPTPLLDLIPPRSRNTPSPVAAALFPIRRAMSDEIQRHAPAWKHPSFAEESEWRLVSMPASERERDVKFRPGRMAIIPYVEIPIGGGEGLHDASSGLITPLANTFIGPCPETDIAYASLQHLLHVQQIACAQYVVSNIPFRHW